MLKINLTPEQVALSVQSSKSLTKSELITRILTLKTMGYTHQQIGDELGYSRSYIDTLSCAINKAVAEIKNGGGQ